LTCQHVKQTCAKIYILSLNLNEFCFPVLSIFHPLAVKTS
jgi:hypothetical protein